MAWRTRQIDPIQASKVEVRYVRSTSAPVFRRSANSG